MNESLLRAVEARREAVVALTRDLIRFPTVNPPGEAYTPCAEYVAAHMRKLGFDTRFIRGEGAPGDTDRFPRTNVVARREGRSPGPTVHFNSHIDVVEEGHGWTVDPFAGLVRDGKVYGRGACDMKGGLAASIIAAEAFMAVYPDFPGAIEISGTADEESGGFGGVAYLANYLDNPLMGSIGHRTIAAVLADRHAWPGHRGQESELPAAFITA
jgi:succinyl-diaminopimelate desuccinylase